MGALLSVAYLPFAVGIGVVTISLTILHHNDKNGNSTPTVGLGSGPLAGQIAAIRSVTSCQNWIQQGYEKYKGSSFAVQILRKRYIMVSGPELIEELYRAPDDVLSSKETLVDLLQADYTLPHWRVNHELGVGLIRSRLTRSLPHLFPAAVDEMHAAFTDEITRNLNGDEWTPLHIWKPVSRVICRTSNRLFVGLPLCRDGEYIDLAARYAMDVALSAMILMQVPAFLIPLVSRFMTSVNGVHARAERIMLGIVTERVRMTAEHAGKEWQDKPDDYLQWALDTGDAQERQPALAMMHILRLNFAAIHTTTTTLSFALYRLAGEAATYQEPLRAEAHAVLTRWGWTTGAMQRLRRLDSFLREVLRFYGIRALSMDRVAMQDFTFSDGTTVKKGQTVSVAVRATHFDEAIYPHAATFDGFRFYDDSDGGDGADQLHLPNRLVSTSTEFLTFGTGRHACPGRFWAANEMKAMMAYMLTHYDMRMERDGVVPDPKWFGGSPLVDMGARVLFRKREAPVY